jgi:FkbH-like protein
VGCCSLADQLDDREARLAYLQLNAPALAEVREIAASPEGRNRTFRLRDQFGDNGLISVILLRKQDKALAIDTWVMSCRVLPRGVEHFARNELVKLCRAEECTRLVGTFIPTPKNGLVVDHYPRLGFSRCGSEGGQTFWELQMQDELQSLPNFIGPEIAHG